VAALLVLVVALEVEAEAGVAIPTINNNANAALMRKRHNIFLMVQSSFLVFCYIALSLFQALPGGSTIAYAYFSIIENCKSSYVPEKTCNTLL
jgi:hypothetical protein